MNENTDPNSGAPWHASRLPPRAAPKVTVARPSASVPINVTVLSPEPICIETHWVGSHEVLCLQDPALCARCRARERKRWAAWLAAWVDPPGRYVAVEITASGARNCTTDHFRDASVSFRGWRMRLTRLTQKRNAPLKVEMAPPVVAERALPQPFDLADFLHRVYKVA